VARRAHRLAALIFAALMGLSILIYVILDGYDLGVGMLMARSTGPSATA
jgi:cytochrome bd-type quinol oxidase subunit 2